MESRFYQSSGLNIERMAYDLEGVFFAQGYQVQHFGNRERMVVQLKMGGDFEALIGMQAALTVTLQGGPQGVMAMIGQQQWVDKAAAGALGMLFLWPLAVTAGVGVIRQATLEGQVVSALDGIVHQQKADVRIGPLPPHLQEQMQRQEPPPAYSNPAPGAGQQTRNDPGPGKIQCLNCQEINDVDDFYCSHCGKPLALLKKRCPHCNAEVKSNAAFCTKCGASFPQKEA